MEKCRDDENVRAEHRERGGGTESRVGRLMAGLPTHRDVPLKGYEIEPAVTVCAERFHAKRKHARDSRFLICFPFLSLCVGNGSVG